MDSARHDIRGVAGRDHSRYTVCDNFEEFPAPELTRVRGVSW